MIQPEPFPDIPNIFQDDDKGSLISYEPGKNFVPQCDGNLGKKYYYNPDGKEYLICKDY